MPKTKIRNEQITSEGETDGFVLTADGASGTAWEGVAGGTITGSGTVNRVAKFTSTTAVGNSNILDDGSTVTVTGAFVNIIPSNDITMHPLGYVFLHPELDVNFNPTRNIDMFASGSINMSPNAGVNIYPNAGVNIYPNTDVVINPTQNTYISPSGSVYFQGKGDVELTNDGYIGLHSDGMVDIQGSIVAIYPTGYVDILPAGQVDIRPSTFVNIHPNDYINIYPSGTVYIHPKGVLELYPDGSIGIHPTAGNIDMYPSGYIAMSTSTGDIGIWPTGTVKIYPTQNVDIHPLGEVTVDAANSITLQQDTYVEENLYVSGSVFTDSFTDYSSTSQIVGWASFTTQQIYYMKIGKLVIVEVSLIGLSNNVRTNFTVPYVPSTVLCNPVVKVQDNGTDAFGHISLTPNSVTGTCYPTATYTAASWTSTGTKLVRGTLVYITS